MSSVTDLSTSGTKARILAAAEQLFIERGFVGTSLRAVTSAAGVNLAAVHYHFGSKEGLLHALLDHYVGPMNRERLARLQALQVDARGAVVAVEEIVRAFVEPALRRGPGVEVERARSLLGRIYGEPPQLIRPLLEREFMEVSRRFLDALERALPELTSEELRWRLQFMVGALVHVISGKATVPPAAHGDARSEEPLQSLVLFLSAGLRARSRAQA